MQTRIMVLALIAVMAVAAVAAQSGRAAVGPRTGMRDGHGDHFGRMARQLNLTKDQIAQLKEVHKDFVTATATTREQLKTKMQQMADLWSADTPDPVAIKALLAEIEPLKAELRVTAVDYGIQALNVLTPDQRVKLRTIMKDKIGHFMGMFGGMGYGGGKNCPLEK